MEILTVENLSFCYPLCNKKALDGISFSVQRGDFIAVCGATGSGKSTLLRMLKRELTPNGTLCGRITLNGKATSELDDEEAAFKIGYVCQHPEQQLVTDKVSRELAFGLENLGIPSEAIRSRVAETACFFGIEDWFDKSTSELSGGQKQLLNLAAVTAMQPDVLLFDEPTSQLDPIAASDFIAAAVRLNRELSVTVIFVEHRLQEVIPASNKVLILDDGKMYAYGETRKTVRELKNNAALLEGMPAAVQLYARLGIDAPCPLDVREGREFIERNFRNDSPEASVFENEYFRCAEKALEFKDVFFKYSRQSPDVLRGLCFTVYEREIFCILGGNGSGKSTALSAASALIKPYSGSISVLGKKLKDYKNQELYKGCLSMLPQDVQTVFLMNTVREELAEVKAEIKSEIYDFTPLLDRHPYDLSGGQQQLLALVKALSSKPRILLLDEPTKGLDAHTKNHFISVIKKLRFSGMTVVCVTHDVEFAALCADRCAMFFHGEIVYCDRPRLFFSSNVFYSTAVCRMTRGYYDFTVTVDDAEKMCLLNKRRYSE